MKKTIQGLLLLLFFASAASSFAEEVTIRAIVPKPISVLPQTGQTRSYPTGGAADRDDGHYQAGNPVSPRFVNNGDGTITDNATGLMWVQRPELIIPQLVVGEASIVPSNQIQTPREGYKCTYPPAALTHYYVADLVEDNGKFYVCVIAHDSIGVDVTTDLPAGSWRETSWTESAGVLDRPASVTWADAITRCEKLIYAGHDDWRLPNKEELASIVDYSRAATSIDPIFGIHLTDRYWSSTTDSGNTYSAWLVDFNDVINLVSPINANIGPGPKGVALFVRPVRGGQ